MPRTVAIPAYKLHKASGQARVIIAGKQFYLGVYGTPESKEKYGRIIAEWKAGQGAVLPPTTTESGLLVVELVNHFRKWADTHYVKNGRITSEVHCIRQASEHLMALYGTIPAAKIGPLAIKAVREKMIEAGLCRSTINSNIGRIRRMFRWGVENELVPPSVYHGLQAVQGLQQGRTQARESAPILPVANEVVDATLPYLPPVVADMVRLQRLIGCRPGEVCAIRPCDIDTSGEVWAYVPEFHKTEHHGRQRRIFIGPKGQDVLRPYLLREKTAYCFSPVESERKRHAEMREARKSKVQPSQINRSKARRKRKPTDCYDHDSYCRAVARGAKLADKAAHKDHPDVKVEQRLIPHWHPNQLRHSVATAIRKQYGIEAAQTVLGHSKADVTQIYAERDWTKAEAVMREVG